jgi:hypothetical protein
VTEQWRSIRLQGDLCKVVEERYSKEFSGIEELVTFLLQALMTNDPSRLDARELEIVEQRLKDLGYL